MLRKTIQQKLGENRLRIAYYRHNAWRMSFGVCVSADVCVCACARARVRAYAHVYFHVWKTGYASNQSSMY